MGQPQDGDAPAVGPGIRRRRRALELTLASVAARSGLSVPFLSQVENGRARPSMSSLQRIADALETTAVQLLAASAGPRPVDVVRADSAAVEERDGDASAEGPAEGRMRPLVRGRHQLHALEFTGAHDGQRVYRHPNDEVMYVADGAAEVEAGDSVYRLERGDTLYCAGGVEHRWRALEPGTRVLIVGIADHVLVADEQSG
ncbi:helix-turn-helix domain-containing protein [Streptomyces sp. ODS28]|uniref:helix-turn-helix domain-containing protein n=1 Tax=Streptomyces sp. ODS28 TaxID=3136688 RepID=UPI0031E52568